VKSRVTGRWTLLGGALDEANQVRILGNGRGKTRSPGSERATVMARHSLVNSSTTVKHLKGVPLVQASWMRS